MFTVTPNDGRPNIAQGTAAVSVRNSDIYIQAHCGPVLRITTDKDGQMTITCVSGDGILSPWSVNGLPAFRVISQSKPTNTDKVYRYFKHHSSKQNLVGWRYRISDGRMETWDSCLDKWVVSSVGVGDPSLRECDRNGNLI